MRALQFLPVILISACGSSAADALGEPVTGTVGPSSVNARSALAWYGKIGTFVDNAGTRDIPGLRVWISDHALSCSAPSIANSVLVELDIYGDSVLPGDYTIVTAALKTPESGEASASYNQLDAECGNPVSASSVSGRLTLTAVDARVAGGLDITFEGGSVSGDFDAELCPAIPDASLSCPR